MWVSKRDLTNDEELPGATLIIKDAKDNVVDTWVSTDTSHRVTGLHFDEEYTLTEKRPADGYAVADDIVFRLERKTDADGHELDEADVYYLKDKKNLWIIPWEEWELLDDATVIMRDDITKVQISKVDIATGKELPGAELVIKDKDGNTVAQWVSEDKPHYIEKRPAGEYTLTEITAPNGYQLAESIVFTVLPTGELQTVVMKDAHIPEETPHEDSPSNTPQPTPGSTPAPALHRQAHPRQRLRRCRLFPKRAMCSPLRCFRRRYLGLSSVSEFLHTSAANPNRMRASTKNL